MTRYYYDCQAEAAFMAKHHGMTYARGDQCVIGWNDISAHPLINCNVPFYLTPESEAMLEYRIGDTIENQDFEYQIVNYDATLFAERNGIEKIIQRNGQAFIWPKEES